MTAEFAVIDEHRLVAREAGELVRRAGRVVPLPTEHSDASPLVADASSR